MAGAAVLFCILLAIHIALNIWYAYWEWPQIQRRQQAFTRQPYGKMDRDNPDWLPGHGGFGGGF